MTQARKTGTNETPFLDFGGGRPLGRRHSSHGRPRNLNFEQVPQLTALHVPLVGVGVVYLESQSEPLTCGLKTSPEGGF